MAENELAEPYTLNQSFNSHTGLRSATLVINYGFPDVYLGTYKFTEWTYGEKLRVESLAERRKTIRMREINDRINLLKEVNSEHYEIPMLEQELLELENSTDIEALIGYQTLSCLKTTPFASPDASLTLKDLESMPGRVGTILSNIAGHLCVAPDAEKKE